jgi:hypothetical protein
MAELGDPIRREETLPFEDPVPLEVPAPTEEPVEIPEIQPL